MNNDNYHFFYDGYEITAEKLSDINLISDLLDEINKTFANNDGKKVIIPYFNNKDILDDGISGIILSNNFHFTCHTFNNMNTLFVDLYNKEEINNKSLIDILSKYFKVNKYDLCNNNEITGKFGKHIIINTGIIPYEKALNLIDEIITNIEMSPIHEKITFVEENGYDILRPIAESHVSIHCHNNKCILDVFSCNNFNEEKIINILNNIYNIRKIERGKYWNKFDKKKEIC